MLTDDDITKYQALYKARFGKDIDRHTARHELSLLVRQMEIIYRPITKQDVLNLAKIDATRAEDETAKSKRQGREKT